MNAPPFIPYARQSINQEDLRAVSEALSSETITRGHYVEEFEKRIAAYCGVNYAVAFNSATSALLAAFHAADIGPYDRIVTSPNTFIASAGAGIVRGAKPLYVDIDRATGNLDLNLLEKIIKEHKSSRGRLFIVPIHFSGIPIEMKKLDQLLRDPHTVVIEDAAHAIGSSFEEGKKVGCCAWSQMTIFSFHPAKTMTTGEGGIVTTPDPELYYRLKRYRNNGIEKDPKNFVDPPQDLYEGYYEVKELTGNYHFTDFQAALGLSQLSRIDDFIQKRLKLIQKYRELLEGLPDLQFFSSAFDLQTAFHLCVVQIDFEAYNTTRSKVMEKLKTSGIGTQVHYIPLYRHPAIKNSYQENPLLYPQMETYFSQALSLPLFFDLSEEDVIQICGTLKDILVEERQKKRHFRKKRKFN